MSENLKQKPQEVQPNSVDDIEFVEMDETSPEARIEDIAEAIEMYEVSSSPKDKEVALQQIALELVQLEKAKKVPLETRAAVRRVVSALTAVAVATSAAPGGFARPEVASAEQPFYAAASVEKITASDSITTETSDEKAIDERISDAAEHERELGSLEDIHPTSFAGREFLKEAKAFVEKNKHGKDGRKVLGEERHDMLVAFLAESMQKIQDEQKLGKLTDEQIDELALITQAAYFDDNELVRAGYPEDIAEAAIRSGMLSRESAEDVKKALFTGSRGYRITMNGMQIELQDGEVLPIDPLASVRQLIGNGPVETKLGVNEGVGIKNPFDMSDLDPQQLEKIRQDRGIVEGLVEGAWPGIVAKISEQGGHLTSAKSQELKTAYVESIMTGEEVSVDLGIFEEVLKEAGDTAAENLALINSTRSEVQGYLEGMGIPADQIKINVSAVRGDTLERQVAKAFANIRVVGARITDDELCRGNYLMIIQINKVTLEIDKDTMDEIQASGVGVVFDRLVLVQPALARSEAGLPEGIGTGTGGGKAYSEKIDSTRPLEVKYQEKHVGDKILARGTSGKANKGGNRKAINQSSAGGNRSAKKRHTGK